MIRKGFIIQGIFPESITDLKALRQAISRIGGSGFYDTVEFSFIGGLHDYQEIGKYLAEWGLQSINLTPGYLIKQEALDLGDGSGSSLSRCLDLVSRYAENVLTIGCRRMVLVSGHHPGKEQEAAYLEHTYETLMRCTSLVESLAGDEELTVSLEYFDTKPPTSHLIGSTATAVSLAERIRAEHDRFELTYDLSHVLQLREDPVASWKAAEPYARHIHLANCIIDDPYHPLYGDCHPPFGYPGGRVGEAELSAFISSINEEGSEEDRELIISPEVIRPEGTDSNTLAEETSTLMQRLFA